MKRMEWARRARGSGGAGAGARAVLLVVLGAAAGGCNDGSGGGPSVDSGSHWLRPCAADDECGGAGLLCVCGLCTRDCQAATACGTLGEGAACVQPDALSGAQCDSSPPSGLCAATCASAADCPDPASFGCRDGLCAASAPTGACQPADCGPAPGMPNSLCPDGQTMAGPTGRCIETGPDQCGWEIVTCPDGGSGTACTPDACGPGLGIANQICADGTLGGPACLPDAGGGCAWQIVECPADGTGSSAACTTDDCGPAPGMPNWQCDDGTVGGPTCVADETGTCGWVVVQCPNGSTACTTQDCGPALGMPNYLCDDGVTVAGPTGRCLAQDTGGCGWEVVRCPAGDGTGAAACSDADCGVAPGMPNTLCSDGTIAGPVCEPDANGVCGWHIVSCPG